MAWQPSRRPMNRPYSGGSGLQAILNLKQQGMMREEQERRAELEDEKRRQEGPGQQMLEKAAAVGPDILFGGLKSMVGKGIERWTEDPTKKKRRELQLEREQFTFGAEKEERQRLLSKRTVEDVKQRMQRAEALASQQGMSVGDAILQQHIEGAGQRAEERGGEGTPIGGIVQPPPPSRSTQPTMSPERAAAYERMRQEREPTPASTVQRPDPSFDNPTAKEQQLREKYDVEEGLFDDEAGLTGPRELGEAPPSSYYEGGDTGETGPARPEQRRKTMGALSNLHEWVRRKDPHFEEGERWIADTFTVDGAGRLNKEGYFDDQRQLGKLRALLRNPDLDDNAREDIEFSISYLLNEMPIPREEDLNEGAMPSGGAQYLDAPWSREYDGRPLQTWFTQQGSGDLDAPWSREHVGPGPVAPSPEFAEGDFGETGRDPIGTTGSMERSPQTGLSQEREAKKKAAATRGKQEDYTAKIKESFGQLNKLYEANKYEEALALAKDMAEYGHLQPKEMDMLNENITRISEQFEQQKSARRFVGAPESKAEETELAEKKLNIAPTGERGVAPRRPPVSFDKPLTTAQKAAADLLIERGTQRQKNAAALIKRQNNTLTSVASYLKANKHLKGVKPPANWDGSAEALFREVGRRGNRPYGNTPASRGKAWKGLKSSIKSDWEETARLYNIKHQPKRMLTGKSAFLVTDPETAAILDTLHMKAGGVRGTLKETETAAVSEREQTEQLEVEGVKQEGRKSVVELQSTLKEAVAKRKRIQQRLDDAADRGESLSNEKEMKREASKLRKEEIRLKSKMKREERREAQQLEEEQEVTTTEKGGHGGTITKTMKKKGTKALPKPDRPKRVPVKPEKTKPKLPVASSAEVDRIVAKGTVSAINAASINLEKTNSLSPSQRTAIRNRKRELRQLKTETTEVQ